MDNLQLVITGTSMIQKSTSSTSLDSLECAILCASVGWFGPISVFTSFKPVFVKIQKTEKKIFSTRNIKISLKYEIFFDGPKMRPLVTKSFSKIFDALLPQVLDLLRFYTIKI